MRLLLWKVEQSLDNSSQAAIFVLSVRKVELLQVTLEKLKGQRNTSLAMSVTLAGSCQILGVPDLLIVTYGQQNYDSRTILFQQYFVGISEFS